MLNFLSTNLSPESDEWSNLYDFYAHIIINFAVNRGCNRELAQDVLQETMLSLWKTLEEHRNNSKDKKDKVRTKAMILTIAHSRLVDLLRKNTRYVELNSEQQHRLSTENKVNWDREIDDHIKNQVISKLKMDLDELKYNVFKMTILEAKKIRDVAKRLSLQPRQVSDIKYELTQRIEKESQNLRCQYDPR